MHISSMLFRVCLRCGFSLGDCYLSWERQMRVYLATQLDKHLGGILEIRHRRILGTFSAGVLGAYDELLKGSGYVLYSVDQ